MSPEQARGLPVDGRSDLFSLGSVLYAMLAGRPPFRAESSYAVLRLITDDEPPPLREINPAVPEWLVCVVGKLMAKRPEDRFATASEAADLLERCLAHVRQPAAVPPPFDPPRPPRRLALWGIVLFVASATSVASPWCWPDDGCTWAGGGWGRMVFPWEGPGQVGDGGGKVRLTWSANRRRYEGTWADGKGRIGVISLRLANAGQRPGPDGVDLGPVPEALAHPPAGEVAKGRAWPPGPTEVVRACQAEHGEEVWTPEGARVTVVRVEEP